MKSAFLFILLLSSCLISVQAQISEKQLKPFIPKGYTLANTYGDGMKQSSGDILLVLTSDEESDLKKMILIHNEISKLTKIAENNSLLYTNDFYGNSGSGSVALSGSILTVSYLMGSSSSQSSVKMMFKKASDGQYYFDSYTNWSRDYGVENLFRRLGFTSTQTGKVNFSNSDEDQLIALSKIKTYQEPFSYETLQTSIKTFSKYIPKGWGVHTLAQGDLNLDAHKEDVLLLLKNENEPNKVKLLILLQQSNKTYQSVKENNNLLSFNADFSGSDPNFGYINGINLNNIQLVIKNGYFTIERRISNYDNNDYIIDVSKVDIPFYSNFFHQYLTFKYDAVAKDWFTYRYAVENYNGFAGKPITTTAQYTALQIGKYAFNQVDNFPDYTYFEPKLTQLYGTLSEKEFFEEPGYGQNPEKDKKVKVFILKTELPIQVYPIEYQDKETGDRVTKGLFEFQVFTTSKTIELKNYIGKKILLEGMLQQGASGHHHTPILIEVKNIKEP